MAILGRNCPAELNWRYLWGIRLTSWHSAWTSPADLSGDTCEKLPSRVELSILVRNLPQVLASSVDKSSRLKWRYLWETAQQSWIGNNCEESALSLNGFSKSINNNNMKPMFFPWSNGLSFQLCFLYQPQFDPSQDRFSRRISLYALTLDLHCVRTTLCMDTASTRCGLQVGAEFQD